MTDDLVGRLRERMAAASEQPWIYRPDKHDDWGFIRGVERDDKGIGPFRPIVAIARDSMVRAQQENEHREAGTDPYGPNALLIVEAVNALPTLLARIEALEAENRKLRDVLGDLEQSATSVHRRGAVTGPQWFRLGGDLILARAVLAEGQSHAD